LREILDADEDAVEEGAEIMAKEPDNLKSDLTKAGLRAWGEAVIKTGTEHLDLAMVRQG
jgi:hypothetical protein